MEGGIMSCFMVSERAINLIATAYHDYEKPNYSKEKLAKKLYSLNKKSVRSRYGNDPTMIPPDIYIYKETHADVFQLIKTISCFLYQSCEGRYARTQLFKDIERFRGYLAMDFIRESIKEYELAEWDY